MNGPEWETEDTSGSWSCLSSNLRYIARSVSLLFICVLKLMSESRGEKAINLLFFRIWILSVKLSVAFCYLPECALVGREGWQREKSLLSSIFQQFSIINKTTASASRRQNNIICFDRRLRAGEFWSWSLSLPQVFRWDTTISYESSWEARRKKFIDNLDCSSQLWSAWIDVKATYISFSLFSLRVRGQVT